MLSEEVHVGVDDIVIYQQKYEYSIRSWLFGSNKQPKWVYNEPSRLLIQRGLTPMDLKEEIKNINEISSMTFTDFYAYSAFSKILSLLLLSGSLILMLIPNTTIRIFLSVVILSVIIGNVISMKFVRPIETSINCALNAVCDYVEITLNDRYHSRNIHWGTAGKIEVVRWNHGECGSNTNQYCHITISCADNLILYDNDDEKLEIEMETQCGDKNNYRTEIIEQSSDTFSLSNGDNGDKKVTDKTNDIKDNVIDSYHEMKENDYMMEAVPQSDVVINTELITKAPKKYRINWAQHVGKKRESWVDPYREEKQ